VANREHLAKIKEGVEAWNDWRKTNPEIVPDLSEAELHSAKLGGADFYRANLYGAELKRADLRAANLHHADLRVANLEEADLRDAIIAEADLFDADLSGADLAGATLKSANLSGANLDGADLSRASIGWTTFGNNDLSEVKGLETVKHIGPSTIGIDTIYRSHGNIPLAFLRGAGVAETFIEYRQSLTGNSVEFYSCFISYSTKDQEFADRLYADLQNKGVRCWFAPHDIQAGKKIHEQIDEAIRRYERLLLILSTESMKSPWVKTEIRKARKREIGEKRRVLFPVSIVPFTDIRTWESFYADEGMDLAEEIREYYIPDFSNWRDRKLYRTALSRLVTDLKLTAARSA
jgi:hypothetical protein